MSKRLKVGDNVVVIAGKDKGRRGRVLKLTKDGERVIVEGSNMITRHLKQNPQDPKQGGRTTQEAALHVSNVMPWSDKDAKGVRVRMGEDDGKKARVSAASGEVIVAAQVQTAREDEAKDEEGGED